MCRLASPTLRPPDSLSPPPAPWKEPFAPEDRVVQTRLFPRIPRQPRPAAPRTAAGIAGERVPALTAPASPGSPTPPPWPGRRGAAAAARFKRGGRCCSSPRWAVPAAPPPAAVPGWGPGKGGRGGLFPYDLPWRGARRVLFSAYRSDILPIS